MASVSLSAEKIAQCRDLAAKISKPIEEMISRHTTVSIERATLRLLGVEGAVSRAGGQRLPIVNAVIQTLREAKRLEQGVLRALASIHLKTKLDPVSICSRIAEGETEFLKIESVPKSQAEQIAKNWCNSAVERIDRAREFRDSLRQKYSDRFRARMEGPPLKYVIVATGNIHQDVIQARAAVQAGAEAIAVIRSTAQSLLDFVPDGATTEGYGGTYATQENFRIMREALDREGEKLGRVLRLTNYCSGLCMSEIAAAAAVERLDFLLNDAMYGILFRDINMKRTLIDQHFSRKIIARSKIVIHTGEDNYLTTADAVENGHQVLASQFINERFASAAGMTRDLMGLGHAQEMNPEHPDVFLLELARAQMTRDIFPESPIKFMPPTRYKRGDVFFSHLMDAMFNFVGVTTGQSIQLLGMMTEAMHTPLLQDRWLSIKNADFIFNGARSLGREIQWVPGGKVESWAQKVLEDTVNLLQMIEQKGLFKAIEEKAFAEVSRSETGGKGHDGVILKAQDYLNPLEGIL